MTQDGNITMEMAAEGVALLTFDRPRLHNALSPVMLESLGSRLDEVERDPAVRVVVLTGAGDKAFVAGADIGEYRRHAPQRFRAYQRYSRKVFERLERLEKPTIAMVNGVALGGGFEIVLCCDLIVASDTASFGLPEGKLGLCPGGGGTQRLTRAVGKHVALDLLLAATRLSAERALALGLVSELAEPGRLRATALEKAGKMMCVAPEAQAAMKTLVRLAADHSLDSGLSLEQEVLFGLYETADAREGISAFFEKRTPEFTGGRDDGS